MSSSFSYDTFLKHETSRMLFEGALNTDIRKVLSKSEFEEDWMKNWENIAISEEQRASIAKENNFLRSAYEMYFRAANYYRLAQYHLHGDSDNKERLLKLSIDNYSKAIEHSTPEIQKISFVFNNIKINGYLHMPNCEGQVPCVICIPGLGHNKESMHKWSRYAIKRGMAVLCVDGPGYGETRILQNVRLKINDFDKYISSAIDFLYSQSYINVSSIGILGDCFGGYLAFRASRFDERIKACAITEAILAFGEYQLFNKPIPSLVMYHLEESELQYLDNIKDDFYKERSNLKNPILIVHAKTDKLIPYSLATELYESLDLEKRLITYDEEHCYENYLINHYNTVLDELFRCIPDVWDWLGSVLKK